MRNRSLEAALLLGVIGFATCVAGSEETPTVVNKMLSNLRQLRHAEVDASYVRAVRSDKLQVEGKSDAPYESPSSRREYLFRRSGDRALVSEHSRPQNRWQRSLYFDRVIDGDATLYVQCGWEGGGEQPDKPENDSDLMIRKFDPRIAGEEANHSLHDVMQSVDDYGIVFGYLGSFPLIDYVGDQASVATEEDAGLVKVDSRSPFGHLQIWLDPKWGGMPRKLILIKQGSDLASSGRHVDEIDMGGDEKTYPAGHLESITWTAAEIQLARANDVVYIADITLNKEMATVAGPVITKTTHAHVDVAEFAPAFAETDFLPRATIPVGYAVSAEKAPQIPLKWDGTQVVAALPGIESHFAEPPRESLWSRRHLFLVANGILAVCLLAGGWFYFRRNRRAKA